MAILALAAYHRVMAAVGDFPGLCLYVARIFPQRKWAMPSHVHEKNSEMIVVLAGRIETRIAGRTLIGRAGDVLFYPRTILHAERALGARPLETICIGWDDAGADTSSWPLIVHDTHGRIQTLARWMYEAWPAARRHHGPLLELLRRTMLHAYTGGQIGDEDEMVGRVKRYVWQNLASPLHLDDLAAVACLSRYHFARRFRKLTGLPPMRFVRESRVDAARTLLLSSNLPQRMVASQVGFPDQFQLSRVFRRQTGQAPSFLRRATTVTMTDS